MFRLLSKHVSKHSSKSASSRIFHMSSTANNEETVSMKNSVRLSLKNVLKSMSEDQIQRESQQICKAALGCPAISNASNLGLYVHCSRLREVDTSLILNSVLGAPGKRCYVPLVEDKDSNMKLLHIGSLSDLVAAPPFGILEPSRTYADGTPRQSVMEDDVHLDVLLMPGLGFDLQGRRLGRGGGYYDKMLVRLREAAAAAGKPAPLLVALSFSSQLLHEVPVGPFDQIVDLLILPDGIAQCSQRGREAYSASST
ncbi:hypothetical protein CEUSTIGMA_g3818.t1 [Chlamydomonas eustigma]|uniref:5-formyltetrahydrofolate cyclo-ligase n=1 Tax=Chlamydomonas eustigma TaxID=1157962 RepID=A0A250X0F2_9CHLO|nr:hypothetical protein CEUSTIGMA_g3818.t1 [Chlamydomonas eustigma]|eukprot:GAX76372.1 hypothetical protein CEUSTIGMA_g3818.t1 [Chlamydomonas eustigma]